MKFAQNELAGAAAMPSAVEILYSLTRSSQPREAQCKVYQRVARPGTSYAKLQRAALRPILRSSPSLRSRCCAGRLFVGYITNKMGARRVWGDHETATARQPPDEDGRADHYFVCWRLTVIYEPSRQNVIPNNSAPARYTDEVQLKPAGSNQSRGGKTLCKSRQ